MMNLLKRIIAYFTSYFTWLFDPEFLLPILVFPLIIYILCFHFDWEFFEILFFKKVTK